MLAANPYDDPEKREWYEGAIKSTGTWNLGTRAGDFVYIAGMRGIDPKTNQLVQGDEARIMQGFMNMKLIAESEGASLRDAVRLVVYVTDMFRFRPIVNKIQVELWGTGPYPPRTIMNHPAGARRPIGVCAAYGTAASPAPTTRQTGEARDFHASRSRDVRGCRPR